MSWQGILGHDDVVERFRRSMANGRLATTFLFVGPEGIGKRTVAIKLAQSILCSRSNELDLAPCGECPECQQVLSDSHPDLRIVNRPADKAFIPVDTFIGDRDHRMRSGLCHFISLKPTGGKRRIAIVDDADWLNQEGANSLLKTLEEPSPGAIIVLISTSVQRQLPTIRSRSQIIRFQRLSDEAVAQCLLQQGVAASSEEAMAMAYRADGSLSKAVALGAESITQMRHSIWTELGKPAIDRGGLAGVINAFLDSGGKETVAKRAQLLLVCQTAIEFYRSLARRAVESTWSGDQELRQHVEVVAERRTLNAEVVVAQLERCVDVLHEVRSNANLGILVDAWLNDLAFMTRTNQPAWSDRLSAF